MHAFLKYPIYADGGRQRIPTDYQFNVPPFPSVITSFKTALSDKNFQAAFREANPGIILPPNHTIWKSPGSWNVMK